MSDKKPQPPRICTERNIAEGLLHLTGTDPVLADVIARVGAFELSLESDYFKGLVRSIIAQQISTGAARSIFTRLLNHFETGKLDPAGLAAMTDEEFRACGLSPQKIRYLRDLAQKVHANEVRLKEFQERSNEEVVEELLKIKGIGVWTAQMFLIFCLGRLDVFPSGDLGVRMAIKKLYRRRTLPTTERHFRKFEKLWSPYGTIACWYCWRSHDL